MLNATEEMRAMRDGHEVAIQCLHQTIEKTEADKPHYHSYIELLYMLDGTACVTIGASQTVFRTGDLVVINSKEPHRVHGMCDISEYLVVKFKPQLLYASEFSVFEVKYLVPFIVSGQRMKRMFTKEDFGEFDIEQIMRGINDEWNRKQVGYEMLMRADILRIFTWIIRFWSRKENYDVSSLDACDAASAVVRRIIELTVDEGRELSCEAAAKYCGMSYSYFSRIFKRVMGMSYTEHLMHIRINKADRMLATTDMTITQIADATGFSSDAYFIRCFRRIKGMTPGKYRAEISEKNKNR